MTEQTRPSVYIKIREGTCAYTREKTCLGSVFEDYDETDLLLGIEFLAPIDVTIDGESAIKAIEDRDWLRHDRS